MKNNVKPDAYDSRPISHCIHYFYHLIFLSGGKCKRGNAFCEDKFIRKCASKGGSEKGYVDYATSATIIIKIYNVYTTLTLWTLYLHLFLFIFILYPVIMRKMQKYT